MKTVEKLQRKCTCCGEVKPMAEFYRKSHWPKEYEGISSYYSECKPCFRARMARARVRDRATPNVVRR